MKNSDLRHILRNKFANHSATVPEGDWQHIADQLPQASLANDDAWQGALANKFANHTETVPDKAWNRLTATLYRKRKLAWWSVATMSAAAIAWLLIVLNVETITPPNMLPLEPETPKMMVAHTQPTTDNRPFSTTDKKIATAQNNDISQTIADATVPRQKTFAQPIDHSETADEKTPSHISAEVTSRAETDTAATEIPVLTPEEAEQLMAAQNQLITRELAARDTLNDNQQTPPREGLSIGLLASLSPSESNSSDNRPMFLADSHIALRNTVTSDAHHDLPFSVGLSIGIPLCRRLDLQTGLTYSYAHSLFSTHNYIQGITTNTNQQVHYLGVPAMLSYRIVDKRIFKFYVSLGGQCEKGLIKNARTQSFDSENALINGYSQYEYIRGVQGSLVANVGLTVQFYKGLGLYFEPGFIWYIPSKHYEQPANSRTVHPYNLSLTAGLRFNIKR